MNLRGRLAKLERTKTVEIRQLVALHDHRMTDEEITQELESHHDVIEKVVETEIRELLGLESGVDLASYDFTPEQEQRIAVWEAEQQALVDLISKNRAAAVKC